MERISQVSYMDSTVLVAISINTVQATSHIMWSVGKEIPYKQSWTLISISTVYNNLSNLYYIHYQPK